MTLLTAVRRLRANPAMSLARYAPGPVHRAFHGDPSRIRLLRGPNQSGKTEAGCKETVDRCLGRGEWQAVKLPPVRGRVVCHSFKQSLVIQRKLWMSIPKGELDPRTVFDKVLGFRHGWVGFSNGSEVRIVTVGQDTLAHASETLDFIWIDEPPTPEVYAECVSRTIQTRGVVFLTLTPIGRPVGWLRDLVDGRLPEELDGLDAFSGEVAHRIEEHHYTLSREHCPWMSDLQVQEAISAVPYYDRPQRILAEWEGLTMGRCFSAFSPACISEEGLSPLEGWPLDRAPIRLVLAADHGEKAAHSFWMLLAYQVDRRGRGLPRIRMRVLGEYANAAGADDLEDAHAVQAMVEALGLRLDAIDFGVGDINTAGKSKGGRKLNDLMTEHFAVLMGLPPGAPSFRVRGAWKGSGSVDYGLRLVNNQFRRLDLLVDPRCAMTVDTCRHWTGESSGKLVHRADTLRYAVTEILREEDASTVLAPW